MKGEQLISIIVCSVDSQRFEAARAMYGVAMGQEPWEIIRIADARSMSEGYNRGIAQSRGEILVFSHDDIEIISPDFPARITKHMESFDIVGVAGTNRLVNGAWQTAGPPYIFGQVAHIRPTGVI